MDIVPQRGVVTIRLLVQRSPGQLMAPVVPIGHIRCTDSRRVADPQHTTHVYLFGQEEPWLVMESEAELWVRLGWATPDEPPVRG